MNHQVNQRISKRVADYFVVVGAGENLKVANDYETPTKRGFPDHHHVPLSYQADIIDRYPLEDRTDFPLPDGIQLFCLPNGLEISGAHPPTFHSFVHTSEHGCHILGCCLTIYEPLTEQQKLSIGGHSKGTLTEPEKKENGAEQFFPLCLCIISHWPFVSSFKSFLCGLYRISVSKSRIPLERYICNFIDEVPSPPAGRVDITYYLGDEEHSQAISFRCPPINQPNVWSSMPLFPLFECLSPDNVLSLFALLLTERQLIFVSSQYSLLTSCAEAVTSLIYPLSWTHAYIPILPRQLLGVLGAPFPFLVGIHSSFLSSSECVLPHEGAVIDLDKNRIHFGRLGPPPLLPDKRCRKLQQLIVLYAPAFERRGSDWAESRLPLFDSAFTVVTDTAAMEYEKTPEGTGAGSGAPRFAKDGEVDEAAIRAGFLNFFVSILKNYRRYIIYGNSSDPDPLVKFRFPEFLAEHSSDWQPFLRELTATQMFSLFIDERALQSVGGDKLQDVIFFDESIDAKMNRYMFKFRNIDTPFLLDNANLHAKTYVPPTPNTERLLSEEKEGYVYEYERFPSFEKLPAMLDAGQSLAAMYQARLKQSSSATAPSGFHLTALECVYSCYLVTVSHLVCNSTRIMGNRKTTQALTTQQIIVEFAGAAAGYTSTCHSVASTCSTRSQSASTVASEAEDGDRCRSLSGPLRIELAQGSRVHGFNVENLDFWSSDSIGKLDGRSSLVSLEVEENGDRNETVCGVGSGAGCGVGCGSVVESLAEASKQLSATPSVYASCDLMSFDDFDMPLAKLSIDINRPRREDIWDDTTQYKSPTQVTDLGSASGIDSSDLPEDPPVILPEGGESFIKLRSSPLDISKVKNGHVHTHHTHTHGQGRPHTHTKRTRTGSLSVEDEATNLAAAKLGLKVSFEVLSSLGRLQEAPDDIVYRSLADACGACGCPAEAVDLLVHLGDEGLLPDNLILTAVARAFAGEGKGVQRLSAAEVWTTHDWSKLQRKMGDSSLYLRKRAKGGTITCSPAVHPNGYASSHNGSNHSSSGTLQNLVNAAVASTDFSGGVPAFSSSDLGGPDSRGSNVIKGVTAPYAQTPNNRVVKSEDKGGNGTDSSGGSNGASGPDTASVTSPSTASPNSISPMRSPRPGPNPGPVSLSSALTMGLFPEYVTGALTQSTVTGSRSPTRQHRGGDAPQGRVGGSSNNSSSALSGQWTTRPIDGLVPELQWKDLSSPHRRPVFAISRLLNRHMLAAERMLDEAFPGLEMDLRNPMGTSCPSPKCRKADREVLSIGELYRGFTSPSSTAQQGTHGPSFPGTGDPHKYTTRCPHCGFQFVPRFTVKCDVKGWMGNAMSDPDNEGSAGQVLWCELLSPWTLRKEMFNVLFQDGVSSLLAEDFHRSSAQHAVVFWNAIISFRLRGLPYAFLLSNDAVSRAFPPRATVPEAGQGQGQGDRHGVKDKGNIQPLRRESGEGMKAA